MRRRAPDWAIDLLGLWIHQDMQEMRAALECRSVSDLFERHTGSVAEPEEVVGYSMLEIRAMGDAVEWLRREHLAHWLALNRQLRPWLCEGDPPDRVLAEEGAQMLAEFVDKCMKGGGF